MFSVNTNCCGRWTSRHNRYASGEGLPDGREANKIASIKSGKRPACDIEIGHYSTNCALLGMLSLKVGRSIEWDGYRELIVGDADTVLVVSGNGEPPGEGLKESIRGRVNHLEVRSVNLGAEGWEVVFELRFGRHQRLEEASLLGELRAAHGVQRISFLAPQLSLPI